MRTPPLVIKVTFQVEVPNAVRREISRVGSRRGLAPPALVAHWLAVYGLASYNLDVNAPEIAFEIVKETS